MVKSNTDEKDFVHLKQDRTQSDNYNKYGIFLAEQNITACCCISWLAFDLLAVKSNQFHLLTVV